MRELAPLPISLATNAYELMEDVNRAILEEPKRLNMENWVSMFKGDELTRQYQEPACGTVCCFAGWVVTLKGRNPADMIRSARDYDIGFVASRLLSGDNLLLARELDAAFMGVDVYVPHEDRDSEESCTYFAGTREYAAAVVARFRVIMDKHEAHLKATAV